jgi:hypothetical protein
VGSKAQADFGYGLCFLSKSAKDVAGTIVLMGKKAGEGGGKMGS